MTDSAPTATRTLRGGCHCGAIRLAFVTALDLHRVAPRACDCSFCTRHAAAYVSDPHGKLAIASAADAVHAYRQGSGAADFLTCSHCGVLVGVVFASGGSVFGAVNVRCLDDAADFAQTVAASPQQLSAEEKVLRWTQLWIPEVEYISVP